MHHFHRNRNSVLHKADAALEIINVSRPYMTVGIRALSPSPASAMTLNVASAVLTIITPNAPALCAAKVFMLKEHPPLCTATNMPATRTWWRGARKSGKDRR